MRETYLKRSYRPKIVKTVIFDCAILNASIIRHIIAQFTHVGARTRCN